MSCPVKNVRTISGISAGWPVARTNATNTDAASAQSRNATPNRAAQTRPRRRAQPGEPSLRPSRPRRSARSARMASAAAGASAAGTVQVLMKQTTRVAANAMMLATIALLNAAASTE